jgi:hypothetical protein
MLGVPFTLIGGLAALIYLNNRARRPPGGGAAGERAPRDAVEPPAAPTTPATRDAPAPTDEAA